MTNTNITDNRAKAIRNIADMLLHLSYIEHQLKYKFINGIGDLAETRFEIDNNYNQRNEIIEDYAKLIERPFDTSIIDKYMNYDFENEDIENF